MLWMLLACTLGDPALDSLPRGDSSEEPCRASGSSAPALLVSHPQAPGGQVWSWGSASEEGLALEGELQAGRAFMGELAWTPDGELGAVALDEGGVAVFRVARSGGEVLAVEVVEEALVGDFYAGRVVTEPGGAAFWIVDPNWPENGGGAYRLPVDCQTGALGAVEKRWESRLASDLLFADPGPLAVAASVQGQEGQLHALSWQGELLRSVVVFDYPDSFLGDAARSPGGRVLVSDVSLWSGLATRVAVLDADLAPLHVLELADPSGVLPLQEERWLALAGYPQDQLLLVGPDGVVLDRLDAPLPSSAAPLGGGAVVADNVSLKRLSFTDTRLVLEQSLRLSGDRVPGVVGVSP